MRTLRIHLCVAFVLIGLASISGCESADLPTAPEATPTFAAKTSSQASNTGCAPPPSGLVSWWPGDGNADDIVDANDGTLVNGATFAPGMVDAAFSFDGTDDYVNTNDLDLPSTFTFSAWIYPNTLAGIQHILSKDDGGGSRSYFFQSDSGGKLVGSLKNTGGAFTQYRTTQVVLSVAQWNYVTLTYDGSLGADQKFQMYVDGQHVAALHISSYDNGGAPENNTLSMKIGILGDGLGHPYNGLIDELAIYNRVLSTSEIQAIFDAGSAGVCKTNTVEVDLDIKPGSDSNSINPRSNGAIPVAILTTADFDATTVDPLSVAFGPDGAEESHSKGHIEDVDGDGDDDLMLHFKTKETGIKSGDTEACLVGETIDGTPIEGCDAIQTVGK